MTALPLEGKLALITGCTGGIGKATAKSLASKGASIAVHYHSAGEVAKELVKELEALGVKAASFQVITFAYLNTS